MNQSVFRPSGDAESPDKVDMSLDDIIRLNKKQKHIRGQRLALKSQSFRASAKGRQPGPGASQLRGGGMNKPFRRRGQGIITGLAARKAALWKGVSPFNRPTINQTSQNKQSKHYTLYQRTQPFVSQRRQAFARVQTQTHWHTYMQTDALKAPGSIWNGHSRLRKRNAPPGNHQQKEARQATFLSRRGLKVQAQIQKTARTQVAQSTRRTQPWRSQSDSTGNSSLTISIDNPGARTKTEPAHSWSLHPSTASPTPQINLPELERKKPKGVALQFDIHSLGKQQTAMTLNERFHILKMKRVSGAQQNLQGGRFITIGKPH